MFWKKKNKQTTIVTLPTTDPLDLNVVIRTDLGNIRTNNEDSSLFVRMSDQNLVREKGYLLIVADGMGGHNAGEVASKMAVDIVSSEYYKPGKETDFEKLLNKAFVVANREIYKLGSSNEAQKGMGTTCTAVAIVGNYLFYGHAGDSRAYLYKDGSLKRITEDHTYVQQLVKDGSISAADAETHPQRNILINAMGTKPDLRVDTGQYPGSFDAHDRLLICSDGLYDYIHDAELSEIMGHDSLDKIADYLISEAKRRGGHDNITVALAEIKENNDDSKITRLTRDADLPAGVQ
ncbi:MAG: Stp1/IreP family PP2C-type Ser/Thr phosphatase [Chitinophagaceae bacterium]